MLTTPESFQTTQLTQAIYDYFQSVLPQKVDPNEEFTLAECAQSGFAIMHQKYASLLQFDHEYDKEPCIRHNLKTLYHIPHAPCDTQLRTRLDEVETVHFQRAFKPLIGRLQRAHHLQEWHFLSDHTYLIAVDGVHFFSSDTIHCPYCTVKKKHRRPRKGTAKTETPTEDTALQVTDKVEYSHSMVVGAMCAPGQSHVLPMTFEPIVRQDGCTKNDCELSAAKRFIHLFRELYPKLPVTMLWDGLYGKGPLIELLEKKSISYIIVVKESDHEYLFNHIKTFRTEDMISHQYTDLKGHHHIYGYMENVPLNAEHMDQLVTYIDYEERNAKGTMCYKGAWITDKTLIHQDILQKSELVNVVCAARARWKIENETFNTLKNQGYHFKHNYGHGKKYLSNNFAGLMLLAFMLDQILYMVNKEFCAIYKKFNTWSSTWSMIRCLFFMGRLPNWESLYRCLINPPDLVCS